MRLPISVAVLILSACGLAAAQQNILYGVAFAQPTCERTEKTTVDCSMAGLYSGKDANTVLTIFPGKARVFAADGTAFVASEFSGGGVSKQTAQANVPFPKNIPVNITFRFKDVPVSLPTLRGLAFETVNYENIAVADRIKAAPDTVTTTALVTLPTKTSAPAKFSVALSDCIASGVNYTCTAKLSPAR
jgi:hypothetical protein